MAWNKTISFKKLNEDGSFMTYHNSSGYDQDNIIYVKACSPYIKEFHIYNYLDFIEKKEPRYTHKVSTMDDIDILAFKNGKLIYTDEYKVINYILSPASYSSPSILGKIEDYIGNYNISFLNDDYIIISNPIEIKLINTEDIKIEYIDKQNRLYLLLDNNRIMIGNVNAENYIIYCIITREQYIEYLKNYTPLEYKTISIIDIISDYYIKFTYLLENDFLVFYPCKKNKELIGYHLEDNKWIDKKELIDKSRNPFIRKLLNENHAIIHRFEQNKEDKDIKIKQVLRLFEKLLNINIGGIIAIFCI